MLKRISRQLDPGISLASRGVGSVGAAAIVMMMFLTFVDVLLRYLFTRPVSGSFELTEYLMVICVSLTLAYCAVLKGHVKVDIVVSLFSARVQEVIRSIVTLLGSIFFLLLTWQSAVQAENIRMSGTFSTVLHLPVFPFVWILFIGNALLSMVFLRDLIGSVNLVLKGKRSTLFWLLLGSIIALLLSAIIFWGKELPWYMTPSVFGLFGIGILLLLMFSGLEIGLVLGITGFLGMAYLSGSRAAFTLLATVPYSTVASYGFSIIPLFVLMGTFAYYAGLSRDIYRTMYTWMGSLPGGLAIATVGGCAGFAAISGSSLATSATMGTVAMREMRRYKYDDKLATGCIAAGGTIGILIPPSVILVIYGIVTEQSIGKLFLAGFIPGILEAVFYMVTILLLCKRNPLLGPKGPKTTFGEKFASLKDSWGLLLLFGLVMGGIYTGICSPTEAAGVGACGAFLLALGKRKLTWENFIASIMESGKTTAMIFLIMIGTHIFGYFLAVTRLPFELADIVLGLHVNRHIVLGIIILVYLFLGGIMSAIAMILITVPIFFPVITALGFDPIWFGIIIVRVSEIGGITPPVGMNVFVIHGVAGDVPLHDIYKGIVPFLIADLLHLALLVLFPQITLFLPSLVK